MTQNICSKIHKNLRQNDDDEHSYQIKQCNGTQATANFAKNIYRWHQTSRIRIGGTADRQSVSPHHTKQKTVQFSDVTWNGSGTFCSSRPRVPDSWCCNIGALYWKL